MARISWLVLVVCLVFSFSLVSAAPPPQRGGTITYALKDSPDRLDPNLTPFRAAQIVYFQIFDTLIIRDKKDKTFKPYLATSWTVSPNGRIYTFKLRPGVKFHDGTPFDAAAVKFNFDRTHDPKLASRIADVAHGFYSSAEVVDPLTVRIHLKEPWSPFLDSASLYYRFVSPAAVKRYGDQDFGLHPVGTGPFKFVEWIPNDHITIVRNEEYNWAPPTATHSGPAYLEKVIFRLLPEDGTRVAALENGEVQVIDVAPPQDVERLIRDVARFKALVGLAPGRPFSYAINVTKPPTNELEVRQALNYGINRPSIVNTVFGPFQKLGAYRAAYGDLTPYTYGYDKGAEIYRYDPSRAKALLDKAGWKPGPDGIRERDGQRLTVVLGSPEHGVPEVMQDQLKQIGIDLKVIIGPWLLVNENQRKFVTHLAPLPGARTDPNIVNRLHSRLVGGGGFNFVFIKNPELDRLIDAQASEVNEARRLQILSSIQRMIMHQAYMLPVYNFDNISIQSTSVSDLEFNELGFFPILYNVWIGKK